MVCVTNSEKEDFMRKNISIIKLLISVFLITSMFSTHGIIGAEVSFSDVKSSDWFYEDVATLVEKTVINGYTDGTFRPSKSVSVAEFIKMSLVATNQTLVTPKGTSWYSKYVETAIAQGYISPSYYKDYKRPITRGEMGDIIDNILNLSYGNTSSYISRINDYDLVASYHKDSSVDVYIAGIITGYSDGNIKSNNPANRSEAAVVIMRMIDPARRNPPVLAVVSDSSSEEIVPVEEAEVNVIATPLITPSYSLQAVTKSFSVDGIQTGMSEDYVVLHLGEPDERINNQYGYEWYVYSGDYSKFKLLAIKDNKVVGFYTNVAFESKLGLEIGSTDKSVKIALSVSEYDNYYYSIYEGMNIQLFSQKELDDGIEGLLVFDSSVINIMNPTREALDSMEKLMFHMTNGARVANGLEALYWSNAARLSSYEHSEDMGINDYFAHKNLSGLDSKARMQAVGIVGNYFAENIAAGYVNPFEFHYALMHSEGHRKNILTERFTHLGVGIYYDKYSKYKYYLTENFFEQR